MTEIRTHGRRRGGRGRGVGDVERAESRRGAREGGERAGAGDAEYAQGVQVHQGGKEAQERATENATFNFTTRRGIAGEIKQYREQKTEAERFETLCQERVRRVRHSVERSLMTACVHRTS